LAITIRVAQSTGVFGARAERHRNQINVRTRNCRVEFSFLRGRNFRRNLTVEEGGEAALGHVVEDEQLLALGAEVVGSERQQVVVADLAERRRLGLELLVALCDLLPEPLDGHQAAILQRGLVHGAVRALPHDLRGGAEQVVGRERERPVEVHELAADVAAGLRLRRPRLLAPPGCRGSAGVLAGRLLPAPCGTAAGPPLFCE
jgi:hypothetical protein